jgi:hypothetical protein
MREWTPPPEPDPTNARLYGGRGKGSEQQQKNGHDGAKPNGHDREGAAAGSRILPGRDFMATFVPPDYVIDGIVQRGRLYACTAITGHGKTAVWLYLGCMVAIGRKIGTIEVAKGNVIYLAGENPDDLCGRMHAVCHAFGLKRDTLPYVLPSRFPLTADAAEALKREIDALNLEPVLIIVDTAAAFFPGEDDNANVQMGDYGSTLRILTTCQGSPGVVVQAHPVKNADRDNLLPRGGGAFVNELDGNLTLWSDAVGESTTLHWQGKIRGPDFHAIPFVLRPVAIEHLKDRKGRPFVSNVAEIQSQEAADNARAQAISDENAVLYWLNQSPGISQASIAVNAGWVSNEGTPHKGKVNRCLRNLKRDKLARNHRGKWLITTLGKAELKAE